MNDLPTLEAQLWRDGATPAAIAAYRDALPETARHDFIVVIPVADRPGHLRSMLDSLLAQCRLFKYGGVEAGRFRKVRALIADDSAQTDNIIANQALAEEFTALGLGTEYFGAVEQQRCLAALPDREALRNVLGAGADHPHKGASVSRNLAYLRLAELATPNQLFFFADSDQQFRVRIPDAGRGRDVDGISYFHTLDRIFASGEVDILTGKVVGDPPVSPAVMVGNFLDDVLLFLNELQTLAASAPCRFHGESARQANDAAYHDMADLFGFKRAQAFRYRCTLHGAHDHRDCLAGFAAHLDRFFDGEHPTRLSHFEYSGPLTTTASARTVYTGNYVFNPAGLEYFIPFATLKLRMAGPVLGRLIKARLGARFVSANLPLLHTRTTQSTGQAEFRPGVDRIRTEVDLSGEFERQFWGDVMLFTIERLIADGYPDADLEAAVIPTTIDAVIGEMQARYNRRQQATMARLAQIRIVFAGLPDEWRDNRAAQRQFGNFIANIEANFSAPIDALTSAQA
ncbi:MAG: hypothetical protein KDI42_06505, partial [Gammaproteobacteria bacterium]|nr:hypothetical protein [Gammaproteobacteria bacterium]